MVIRVNFNETYKHQQKKLIPATFKKALVVAVYPDRFSVDVVFIGNNQTSIRNIAVATNVNINFVNPGDKCRVDLFDEKNPNDMVLAYTYGKPSAKNFITGSATVTTAGIAINHGLGQIPDIVMFIKLASPTSSQSITGGAGGTYGATVDVYENAPADATNIFLKSTFASISVQWTVIRF